jgi:hypothetical protein
MIRGWSDITILYENIYILKSLFQYLQAPDCIYLDFVQWLFKSLQNMLI